MPSFLSKVFGRKKHDDHDPVPRASDVSLLEGKFEAISPTVSPTATHFAESVGKDKENTKDKDGFFGLVRSRSRANFNPPPVAAVAQQHLDDLPHLTLDLLGSTSASTARAFGVTFEDDPTSLLLLSDSELEERRLSPAEALNLVNACSQVITTRGLETLGIMHPHWYSASPDVQRRLLSLFIRSLHPDRATTLSPPSPSDITIFESELNFTRSPHDIAAVFRWGLRHLKLEGTSFGKDQAEWSWYSKFSQAERQSSYPPNAYSNILTPQVVPAHLDLLSATLEILSSLAAHAEANSISGSKLSKFLGFWLLCAQRFDPTDDWPTFYARWEKAGRILEHLFFARIRDESLARRMPTRLLELVHQYPYAKETPSDEFLPRPKFSTRQYDALFVRIETETSSQSADQTKLHPIRLVVEALKAQHSENGPDDATWSNIRTAATSEADEEHLPFDGRTTPSSIFAEETIRFLSLLPAETPPKQVTTPKFTLLPTPKSIPSPQPNDKPVNGTATPSAVVPTDKPAATAAPTGSQVNVVVTDWTQFASAGFHDTTPIPQILAGTFLDKDVEKTVSTVSRKPGKKRKAVSPARSKRSVEADKTTPAEPAPAPVAVEVKAVSRSTTAVAVVQLDEAFVDFWSDALLDPIASAAWPNFVICKLKNPVSSASPESGGKAIRWVVVEHVYRTATPPPPLERVESVTPQTGKRARPSSPKPSFRSDLSASRMSTTIAATKKRFSFFTNVRTSISNDGERSAKVRKKAGKAPRVGEMGEILSEEEEGRISEADQPVLPGISTKREPLPEVVKPVVAAMASVTAAAAVVAATVEDKASKPVVAPAPTPPIVDAAERTSAAVAPSTMYTQREVKVDEVIEAPVQPLQEPAISATEPTPASSDEAAPAPAHDEDEVQVLPSAELVPDAPAPVEVPTEVVVPEVDEPPSTAGNLDEQEPEVSEQPAAVEAPATPSPPVEDAPPTAIEVEEEIVPTKVEIIVPTTPPAATVEVQEDVASEVVEPIAEAQEPIIQDPVEAAQIITPVEPVVVEVEVPAIPEATPAPELPVTAVPVEETAVPAETEQTPVIERAETPPAIVQEIQAEEATVDVEAKADVAVAQETSTPIADEDVADIPIGGPAVPEAEPVAALEAASEPKPETE